METEQKVSKERMERYTWKDGDVKIYDSLEELKKDTEKRGGEFIEYKTNK